MTEPRRIVVGISGGVDSSVAAWLLHKAGHEVIGLFMKNWEEDDDEERCGAADDLAMAQSVCDRIGVELRTINFSHEYWENVFTGFLDEYQRGRTPNPDVLCNREIKFKEFLEFSGRLGADAIATGHYCRADRPQQRYRLLKGTDPRKDQSYFLYTLGQTQLARVVFPLGGMTKRRVRELAAELGFPNADRKDSTGICFIGERRFKQFLKVYLPPRPGDIRTLDDEVVGHHDGLMYYTIGQRQGLGIGGDGEAWYVADKDLSRRVLYVVQGRDHPYLLRRVVEASNLTWVAGQPPRVPLRCHARIRYRQDDQPCTITRLASDFIRVEFDRPQWAVTPGQSIVLYDDDVCLGGGMIDEARN
jgi:tRNA-specific 2-thiouridylase